MEISVIAITLREPETLLMGEYFAGVNGTLFVFL